METGTKRNEVQLSFVPLSEFLCRRLTKTRLRESWVEQLTPPAIYSIVNYTMIHVFELPFVLKGGRVLNQ